MGEKKECFGRKQGAKAQKLQRYTGFSQVDYIFRLPPSVVLSIGVLVCAPAGCERERVRETFFFFMEQEGRDQWAQRGKNFPFYAYVTNAGLDTDQGKNPRVSALKENNQKEDLFPLVLGMQLFPLSFFSLSLSLSLKVVRDPNELLSFVPFGDRQVIDSSLSLRESLVCRAYKNATHLPNSVLIYLLAWGNSLITCVLLSWILETGNAAFFQYPYGCVQFVCLTQTVKKLDASVIVVCSLPDSREKNKKM